MGSSPCFPQFYTNGYSFYGFLFGSLNNVQPPKWKKIPLTEFFTERRNARKTYRISSSDSIARCTVAGQVNKVKMRKSYLLCLNVPFVYKYFPVNYSTCKGLIYRIFVFAEKMYPSHFFDQTIPSEICKKTNHSCLTQEYGNTRHFKKLIKVPSGMADVPTSHSHFLLFFLAIDTKISTVEFRVCLNNHNFATRLPSHWTELRIDLNSVSLPLSGRKMCS